MSAHEATATWAQWACARPETCAESHCARCGEHVGGQGHAVSGIYFDGAWRSFGRSIGLAFECDEAEMSAAIKQRFGDEYWCDRAMEAVSVRFRPDRRAAQAQGRK